jgi:hypothetical protein
MKNKFIEDSLERFDELYGIDIRALKGAGRLHEDVRVFLKQELEKATERATSLAVDSIKLEKKKLELSKIKGKPQDEHYLGMIDGYNLAVDDLEKLKKGEK